jgi:hypothetical protein
MHKSLPPVPSPQALGACTTPAVWSHLPPDRRQQCHALLAQLLIDVSHRTLSEECSHEHQDSRDPSPT